MFHPLIKLLATQPQLLVRHASAYADLAGLQAGQAVRAWRLQAVLTAAAAAAGVLGTGLAGVALLLLAVVPVAQTPAPWLLATAPAVPLLLAGLLWRSRTQAPLGLLMAPLQAQWAADLQLLADAQRE